MGDPDRLKRSPHADGRRVALTIATAAILGAVACGGASVPPDAPAEAESTTPVVEVAAPSTTKVAEVAGPDEDNTNPSTGWAPYPPGRPSKPGKIDIPECDAYFDTIARCLDAMGGKSGGMIDVQGMIEQIRDTFRQVASTPEGRQQLATTCKGAQDTMITAAFCR